MYVAIHWMVCKHSLPHYAFRASGPLEVDPGSDFLSGVDQQAAEGGGGRAKGAAGSSGARAEHAEVDSQQV